MLIHGWRFFFTDIGWVEFEPTAGLPVINRQDESLLQSANAIPLDKNDKSTDLELINTLLNFLVKLGIWTLLIGLISFATLWIESVILFLQPVSLSLTQIFKRMEKLGNRLIGKKTGETPYEYSDKLKSRMNSIVTQRAAGKSSFIREIDLITDSYVLSSFSQNPVQRKNAFLVIHSWRRLRLRLMLEIFLATVGARKGSG
jgi:hypothetical protein